jgi:hypothetical protein
VASASRDSNKSKKCLLEVQINMAVRLAVHKNK